MASFSFRGLDQYMSQLSNLAKETDHIVHSALYQGAKVVADAVKRQIDNIPEYKKAKRKTIPAVGLTRKQKDGLKDGLGVAHHWDETSGSYTKIGFKGYNNEHTKKYPQGQPNPMIARSIIRGTSYLQKYDFVKIALNSSRAAALKAIEEEIEKQIESKTK